MDSETGTPYDTDTLPTYSPPFSQLLTSKNPISSSPTFAQLPRQTIRRLDTLPTIPISTDAHPPVKWATYIKMTKWKKAREGQAPEKGKRQTKQSPCPRGRAITAAGVAGLP
ncbi:hypothetical protein N7517_000761 [Penicillium concentricum]|uniref:Uncharacterized protein n=1 Tax=Penicillium concentricum TaxID=293559 RepID=A0A9W9SQR6_9EURO|nr:uncharacterized protein N7517_000761 [Penicillium concentricum]KAJ5382850.1 hypothetical protein N7517_000761 [Penicillium concentricum]